MFFCLLLEKGDYYDDSDANLYDYSESDDDSEMDDPYVQTGSIDATYEHARWKAVKALRAMVTKERAKIKVFEQACPVMQIAGMRDVPASSEDDDSADENSA
jgi:hypothetical protein